MQCITIIEDTRAPGDEFTATGTGLEDGLPACPYGQGTGLSSETSFGMEKYSGYSGNADGSVSGMTCTKTFLGESCTNWTV